MSPARRPRRRTLAALLVGAAFLSPALAARALAAGDIRDSVVKVYATSATWSPTSPWRMLNPRNSSGSGAILAGRRILTAAHVVADATFLQVRRAGQARKHQARVAFVSHELDLALLEVEGAEKFFAGSRELGIGPLPAIGDPVTVHGFPEGGSRITLTEGIVSRIDRDLYAHSLYENMVVQMDAAINSGASGGALVSEGAIVGVCFQGRDDAENVGYAVPAPVIRQFLTDVEDGRYDGLPAFPVVWQNLENPQFHRYHGMEPEQSGVRITEVAPVLAARTGLRAGDVLLAVDGLDVADDGTVEYRPGERISFEWALERHVLGDRARLRILRDGEERDMEVPLDLPRTVYDHLIPRPRYEERPAYYVLGGLVFSPLSANYLRRAWKKVRDAPLHLQRYYRDLAPRGEEEPRDVVVMVNVLDDPVNVGYAEFEDLVVERVNGRPVRRMQDLIAAVEEHDGPFHEIELEPHGARIVLEREELARRTPVILANYGVSADRSPGLDEPRRPPPGPSPEK